MSGPKGPEAGVWVIAETTGLPTKFVRIVVTDDRGRYLVAGSAEGHVQRLGARLRPGRFGQGRVHARAGSSISPRRLRRIPHAAAQYYPAGYWFSLIKVPDKSEFPGTGPSGNGISPNMKNQAEWLRTMKSGTCWSCHRAGHEGDARAARRRSRT